ncbi:hypothetical protein llap_5297 [Limosa lapponica baueri]|uniref:Uncharacterized protein n=1 Tax=Limosa lapponica baueri TaxID=1758121 RepID=A0A2I0UEE4_LIMLA|nr:hypothetical protein llap_5297 [Limosa lapponica baueri]
MLSSESQISKHQVKYPLESVGVAGNGGQKRDWQLGLMPQCGQGVGGQEGERQEVRGTKETHGEECRGLGEGNVLQGTVIEEKETNWLIQLIIQTDLECFDNYDLVLSFHSKKNLDPVLSDDRLVMTGIKTGISGSEGMG